MKKHEISWETEKKHGKYKMRLQTGGSWFDSLLLFCGTLFCLGSAYWQLYELLESMQELVLPKHTLSYVMLLAAALSIYYGSGIFRRMWMRLLPLLPMAVCFGRYYRIHRLQIEDGILYLLRMYAVKISVYYEHSFLFPLGEEAKAPAALVFWGLLIFLGLFVFTAAFRQMEWMLALPLAMLAAGLAVGRAPGWESMLLLFASVLIFRAYRVSFHQKPLVRMAQLAGVAGICLLAGAALSVLADDVVAKHDMMMERQLALEDAVLALPVWNLFSQDGTVTNDAPIGNGREVLAIALSEKPTENVYLKTYAADHYESGRWSISEDAFAQAVAEQGMTVQEAGAQILNMPCEAGKEVLEPGDARTAVDHLAVAAPKQYEYTINCRNFGKTAPLPYASLLPEEFVTDGDTAAQKPWMKREYSGTLMMGGNSASPLTKYLYSYYIADLWSVKDMLISDLSMTNEDKQQEEAEDDWYSDYVWRQSVGGSASEAVEKRLEEYLQIFGWMGLEEFRSYLSSIQELGNASLTNAIRMENVPIVQAMLNDIGSYSRALDSLSAETDPIDYFLNTSGEGYCVHFASAATLMLQAMDIPARYASGYVVFPKDFEKTEEGYTAVVTDARAHAWVEVYVDGFGWVPYEVTPGFSGAEAPEGQTGKKDQETDGKEQEKTDQSDLNTEEQENDQSVEDQKEEPEHKTDENRVTDTIGRGLLETELFGRTLFWWLSAVIALTAGYFVICLTVDGIRMYKRKQEQLIRREMAEGHNREAILRINSRMYRMLAVRELLIGRTLRDDARFCRALRWFSAFREAAVNVDLYMKLVREAYFSNEEMRAEDAEVVYEIYCRCRLRRNLRLRMANTGYRQPEE